MLQNGSILLNKFISSNPCLPLLPFFISYGLATIKWRTWKSRSVLPAKVYVPGWYSLEFFLGKTKILTKNSTPWSSEWISKCNQNVAIFLAIKQNLPKPWVFTSRAAARSNDGSGSCCCSGGTFYSHFSPLIPTP